MRRGVLGGTFDPPHLGHLVLGAAARRALALDQVLFVPAGDPYRKSDRRVTPAATRLRLIEAAVAPLSWARVSPIEVDREGPTYSWQTMLELGRDGGDWWFIMGLDALVDLPNWDDPGKLPAVSRLGVASRRPLPDHVPDAVRDVVPDIDGVVDYVAMPPVDLSSTDLRARVSAGLSTEILVPEGVREIIEAERLYAGGV
ncbi:MAG: nicotinate-nucleotide adenylyltransferase [Dehalococcoidia bacterium]